MWATAKEMLQCHHAGHIGQQRQQHPARPRLAPKGKSATRAATDIEFFKPVMVGNLVSCYAYVVATGNTSVKVHIDVYVGDDKVAHGDFVNVALTKDGQVRSITDK